MDLDTALSLYAAALVDRGLSPAHLKTVRYRLDKLNQHYPGRPLAELTGTHLLDYMECLKRKGLADATLAGNTRTIKAFFRWLKKRGYMEKNLTKGLKNYSFKPKRNKAAKADDLLTLAQTLPGFADHRGRNPRDIRDALIVSLSLDTGARTGELHSLTWSKVTKALENPLLTVDGLTAYQIVANGKTGERPIYFFSTTASLFEQWRKLGQKNDGAVFTNLWTGEKLNQRTINGAFERVCAYAGLSKPIMPQAIRKRNGTEMIRLGKPGDAQAYLGHTDIKTTLTFYEDVRQEEVMDVAAKMAEQRRDNRFADEFARLIGVKGS